MKSKKDILCLSWCDADEVMNYGQILQGCAMMFILRSLSIGKIVYISYCPRGIRGKLRYNLKHYNPKSGHLNAYLKTKKIINKFIYEYNINFYQLTSPRKLESLSKDIEVMVCGSDQIWHPQNYDKNYFLDFGNTNAKRISYAASIPKTQIEHQFNEQMEKISHKLKRLDRISIREKGSVDFVSKLSGKNVSYVLDPTYLVPFEVWEDNIEIMNTQKKYIFVYIPNGMNEKMANCVGILKKQIGVEDVLIMQTRGINFFSKGKFLKFISLGQFLYLIKNAECVLTSSFHAVVFSTIFRTNFWCYDVPNSNRGEDIRLEELLDLLGLEERKIVNENQLRNNYSINYDQVFEKIYENKKDSLRFLSNEII